MQNSVDFIRNKQSVYNSETRKRGFGKVQYVARPSYDNATVHFLLTYTTNWLCYCHLANDL